MVNVVFRHGARSPLFAYPNDRYQLHHWPGGAGQLTQVGMRLEFNLGKFLRHRYVHKEKFIGPEFRHDQVFIQSSDVGRCLQSAQTQLSGLFPPHKEQVWNPNILWQPIPVHTTPKEHDAVLRASDDHCPRRQQLWKMKKKEKAYLEKKLQSEQLLSKLSNLTGMHVTFHNLFHITDAILSENSEHWPQPQWVNELWSEMLGLSDWIFLQRYRGGEELGRLLGGHLLGKLIQNMDQCVVSETKVNETSVPPKLIMFSGHDTSMLSLSTALDIHIDRPIFASCIIIELHTTGNSGTGRHGYNVVMYYRNNYTDTLEPLKLRNCSRRCPFDEFVKLTSARVSAADRASECSINPHDKLPMYSVFRYQTWVVLSAIACLLSFILLVIAVRTHHRMCVRPQKTRGVRYLNVSGSEGDEEERDNLIS